LAFDTIYAEGQRRYVETFSAYARQFLGGLERPDVDKIDGLSPVIAIEQKQLQKSTFYSGNHNRDLRFLAFALLKRL
jgi:excinuclease ABC subunit A